MGEEVGYQVRFERRLSRRTRLRFLTEGVLTRQLLADPFLEGVGAVILDEFHERNLNSDLALALLRQVRATVRPDLMLVVMSATLDAAAVSNYLDGCPIVRVDGGLHEVSVQYRPVEPAGRRRADRSADRRTAFRKARFGPSAGLSAGIRGDTARRQDGSSRPPRVPVRSYFRCMARCRPKSRIAPCGRATAEDHLEHERCRDLAHDRRGDHGHRQRTGPDRPLRWCAGNRPLGNGPDQSRRG